MFIKGQQVNLKLLVSGRQQLEGLQIQKQTRPLWRS